MSGNALFESLQPELLEAIADSMAEHVAAEGEVIIRQGDPGDHLYIVHSGAFAAFVADAASGQEAKVADYKSGQYFGELALLYNSPRAATVRAQETGTCYCLDRATFRTLVQGYLTK